jgi:hypothetical protein
MMNLLLFHKDKACIIHRRKATSIVQIFFNPAKPEEDRKEKAPDDKITSWNFSNYDTAEQNNPILFSPVQHTTQSAVST